MAATAASDAARAALPAATVAGRADDLTYDLGNLLAVDPQPVDAREAGPGVGATRREQYLRRRGRDAMQLLVNRLWDLPLELDTLDVVATLPTRRTVIPRMTRMPTPVRNETRYDQWMRAQGVQKRTKRERFVFDSATGEQRPRWGMNRVNNAADEWVVEHRNTQEHAEAVAGGSDPFALRQSQKRERVAKQRGRQERNRADAVRAAAGGSAALPGALGVAARPADAGKLKADLAQALSIAQRSSASLGKFDQRLPGESAPRRPRRHAPVAPASGGAHAERGTNLRVLDRVLRGPVGSAAADIVAGGKAAKLGVTGTSRKRAGVAKKGGKRR